MQLNRLLAFYLTAAVIWIGWSSYLRWRFPPQPPALEEISNAAVDTPTAPGDSAMVRPDDGGEPSAAAKAPVVEPIAQKAVPLRDDLTLGEDAPSPNAEFQIFARFTNAGAAVTELQLNRFRNERQTGPMQLLHVETPGVYSFVLTLNNDRGVGLQNQNWEVVDAECEPRTKLVFRAVTLGGKLEVKKIFTLEPDSAMIRLAVETRNLTAEPMEDLVFSLTSGNGLPIEGRWYTYYFRRMAALLNRPNLYPLFQEQYSEKIANGTVQEYSNYPPRWAGVVDQYFASLVVQDADPLETRLIESVAPELIERHEARPEFSNITARLTLSPITLAADGSKSVEFLLYNGPKEERELARWTSHQLPFVLHYPDFLYIPIGRLSQFLVWVLNALHSFTFDHGIAIILLTFIVRGLMFPLSFKQARMTQRMQELQPKIEELKKKYGDDREKMAHAQMELFRKENVNPLGGCLPLLLQIPIFCALYQGLYNSFSLRHSSFLWGLTWIRDLSAPDQLFPFGFDIPLLGPYFNLLPVLASVQMYAQAKLTMPPPANAEQEFQQKFMSIMMLMMSVMFFKVPAGLTVYIITSTGWSMLERQFLPKAKLPTPTAVGANGDAPPRAELLADTWKQPVNAKDKRRKR